MVRSAPPSDWIVYLVVLGVAAATLFGKHLIMKGDEPISEAIKDDIKDIEETVENIEEKAVKFEKNIEEKLK